MRVLSFGIYLPFFVLGLILSLQVWQRCSLIYLFVIVFSLLHIFTWASIRYRLPIDAALMPFAGLAIFSIWKWIWGRITHKSLDQKFQPQKIFSIE